MSHWCWVGVLVASAVFVGCNRTVAGGKADGPAIFSQVCASCHGPEGEPNATLKATYGVRDLTSASLHKRLTDEQIRHQVRHGSKDKRMPAFGAALSPEQIDAVVRHVRGLVRPGSP